MTNMHENDIKICLSRFENVLNDNTFKAYVHGDVRRSISKAIGRSNILYSNDLIHLKDYIKLHASPELKEAYYIMVYLRFKKTQEEGISLIDIEDFQEAQKYLRKTNSEIMKRIKARKSHYLKMAMLNKTTEIKVKQPKITDINKMLFLENLEKIRIDKNMIKASFSRMIGVSISTYCNWINLLKFPNQANRKKIYDGLNMTELEILNYKEQKGCTMQN